MNPEARARLTIDALLTAAGWHVCNAASANLHAGSGAVKGVAIREFPLKPGHGFADYLLYVNGKACGVIEAKKEGATLSGVEVQSARYAQGLPAALPAWRRPLPFVFESTGVETRFTNGLYPAPHARPLFAFFRPELLLLWLKTAEPPSPNHIASGTEPTAEPPAGYLPTGRTSVVRASVRLLSRFHLQVNRFGLRLKSIANCPSSTKSKPRSTPTFIVLRRSVNQPSVGHLKRHDQAAIERQAVQPKDIRRTVDASCHGVGCG